MKKSYEELFAEALEVLKTDDEIFVEAVNEMDTWNGFADGFRCYPMYELDELFGDCKVSEFLDKLAPGFNQKDEWMVDTIYGLDSTDDIADTYRRNVWEEDLLKGIIEDYNHLWFSDDEFSELISSLANYDDDDEEEEEASEKATA